MKMIQMTMNMNCQISKYDENQEALVEQTKRTLVEKEKEPRTPSQSASEEGEDEESMDKECCGSTNRVMVKLQHQEKCGSPSYVHYRMHTSK